MTSDSLYRASIVRSILFYGAILAVCVTAPLLVCVGIAVFFLRFYRRPVTGFLEDRGREALVPAAHRRVILPEGVVRIEPSPPGFPAGDRDGPAGGAP